MRRPRIGLARGEPAKGHHQPNGRSPRQSRKSLNSYTEYSTNPTETTSGLPVGHWENGATVLPCASVKIRLSIDALALSSYRNCLGRAKKMKMRTELGHWRFEKGSVPL